MTDRPLEGRSVVVTRPRGQAGPFSDALRELGAEPVEFPTISIRPPDDRDALREGIAGLEACDWVVLTSVNGVEQVFRTLDELGRTPEEAFASVRTAAIGPSTADALREAGVAVEVVPGEYRAEALVEALEAAARLDGRRVLLPRADGARDVLPRRLRAAGARVEEIAAYRTVRADPDVAGLADRIGAGEIDWVTFTASSTVRNFVELVGAGVGRARVAAIGPVTADTAERLELPVDVIAEEYTIPGLVRALVGAERARTGA